MSSPRLLLLPFFLSACASSPPGPDVEGQGLVSVDATPPPGAELFERPQWHAGDRFVFRNGDRLRLRKRVVAGAEGRFELVDEDGGGTLELDADLGELGERNGQGEAGITFDPVDVRFAWPLWVGKRWSSHYVRRAPGQPPLPLLVQYHCDAIETVEVPAGTFRCLRIWRTASVAAQGDYIDRVSLLWYAPEVGNLARRLSDSLLLELDDWQRQ